MADAAAAIEAGRAALRDGDWETAEAGFRAAADADGGPAALDGLGFAIWLRNRPEEGVRIRETAVRGYVQAGDPCAAAKLAVWIAHKHRLLGSPAAANGWLARAERLLEGIGPCAARGWLEIGRARHAVRPREIAAHAESAMRLGAEFGDADLEIFGLSWIGQAHVADGRHDEGMTLLDEALARAMAGEVADVLTTGETYCSMLVACHVAADFERATEWCRVVDDFSRRYELLTMLSYCRGMHADVLCATGRYAEAEQELELAIAMFRRTHPAMAAQPLALLAELRILQNRLDEARALLPLPSEHPDVVCAETRLLLARDDPEPAVEKLERLLAAPRGEGLSAVKPLALLAEALAACGEPEAAARAAERLADIAAASERPALIARSALVDAYLARAGGGDALPAAQRALALFSRVGMPCDAARARLEVARALAPSRPAAARAEAEAAAAAVRVLGAHRLTSEAAAVLRELGAGTAPGPRVEGELSARELEVLGLVATGMTNAQIGAALFISRKTAGHHVSRILSKLGLSNRAEAAGYAARMGISSE